jgi:hypothetical protein
MTWKKSEERTLGHLFVVNAGGDGGSAAGSRRRADWGGGMRALSTAIAAWQDCPDS